MGDKAFWENSQMTSFVKTKCKYFDAQQFITCIQVWAEFPCWMKRWWRCVMYNKACYITNKQKKRFVWIFLHTHTYTCAKIFMCVKTGWKYEKNLTSLNEERDDLLNVKGVAAATDVFLQHQHCEMLKTEAIMFFVKHQPRMLLPRQWNLAHHKMQTLRLGEVRPRTRLTDTECIILAFHTSLSIFPPNSLHTCFYIQR